MARPNTNKGLRKTYYSNGAVAERLVDLCEYCVKLNQRPEMAVWKIRFQNKDVYICDAHKANLDKFDEFNLIKNDIFEEMVNASKP